ncbi:hypothetical protein GCM10010919_11080 [Alishewanella longhuensis]|uniref:Methyltransferase type 11 domain-containing protein n=1 Tax=Alishewanella longhuensis TaxID=1091037 RepID=A0ABQ3KYK7_9ALTE|nr:class I SAM-dependent methyltransferase [Alishewanella longhuensis]GHG64491.1 hypothetical protein GCM10010919_11080 [Alishewanella longhuensis]
MSAHWSQFWQTTKTLNSFSASENAFGYRGELLAFWQQQFSNLGANAQVVDLGTGNGALALAAYRYATQHHLNALVHGVDAAAINPCAVFADEANIVGDLRQIQFHPECSIEAMPFKSGSVDILLSQFALEYAECEPAVAACARVLAPKGRLVAVMHHQASDIAYDCAAGLKVIAAFLYGSNFQHDANQLLSLATSAATAEALSLANQQLLQSVSAIEQQLRNELEQEWFGFVMQSFAPLFININTNHQVRFKALLKQLVATYQRLTDQHRAALNQESIVLWVDAFKQQQLDACYEELVIDKQLFGWVLKVSR